MGYCVYILMFVVVTGSSGGKRKRMVVTVVYARPTKFAIQPSQFGNANALGGSIFRPRQTLIAMGIAYDTPRATTEAEISALKALLEPIKIKPKRLVKPAANMRAFRGCPSRGWTFEKNGDQGTPPSLAKAYVMRDEVVMIAISAKRIQPSGNMSRHTAPALLPVALLRIVMSGPAVDSMIAFASPPDTNRRIMRKKNPVTVPMQTQ
jgi:hypothetical protein